MELCECGCGKVVTKDGNRFIHGHNGRCRSEDANERISASLIGNTRGLGYEHTESARHRISDSLIGNQHRLGTKQTDSAKDKVSAARIGVKNTTEHNANISAGKKLAYRKEGGNPIENHHVVYDHTDKTRFTIPLRRSAHEKVHAALRRTGFKIPHIHINGVI